MTEAEERKAGLAATAESDDLFAYVHDPSVRVLRSLLANPNLTEEHVLIIANRKNLTIDILETIARDKRWSQSYPLRLALARNPRSPLSVSLSITRFLRVFDLEEITRNPFIPLVLRHKVETMLVERIPTMPLGNKKTLAKKAAGKVLFKLLQERIPEVVRLCLDNPHMLEAHLYKLISRDATPAETIVMIAGHPVWSNRPLVRFSLTRNAHTPLSMSMVFIKSMKLVDLRELYQDPSLPVTVKPFVYRELRERGTDPEKAAEETIYEVDEEDEIMEESGTLELNEPNESEDDAEEDDDTEGERVG